MRAVKAEVERRHPQRRVTVALDRHGAVGHPARGWAASVIVASDHGVFARHEVFGPVPGRTAAMLALSLGVAIDEPEVAR